MWKKSVTDKFSILTYIICLALALSGKVPPSITVIFALFFGIFWQKIEDLKKNKGGEA